MKFDGVHRNEVHYNMKKTDEDEDLSWRYDQKWTVVREAGACCPGVKPS